ncbi:phosphoserine phosphatase [Photobacterium sp. ZSDE20]|uniref:Phosphoserine phosphatase n=1 Tax=Photobacterium pectinilyticum TaxID=2906793 RepID=A0ABT1N757_9GAMM|nr:phosphoserine phosphatase [Photobacterium sp. ZSDE20]MCQ1060589.1 phosphoserine phosphatase [Photobacterium sp. ZSDE20]MDD1828056.1 phosphoserine phosphatase [Photobacterium sp. ZSDE20]
MDGLQVLKIRKHTSLLQRFPEVVSASNRDRQRSTTLIFGRSIDAVAVHAIEAAYGAPLTLTAAWKVGQYDCLLLATPYSLHLERCVTRAQLDIADLTQCPDLREPGLVVMDMDSTAIEIECIDEIAILAGVGEQVAEVTERTMLGELDFEQSLRQRVAALAGSDAAILEQVKSQLPFMPELRELVATLHHYGWKAAIASGGFTYFSDHLKQELDLAHAQSNTLEIVDGKLTGQVLGDVVDAQAKATILRNLAEQHDILPHNTVAVGDGANDLVMINAAGLGVAYHAKPKVEDEAPVAIRFAELGGLICLLSVSLVPQQLGW